MRGGCIRRLGKTVKPVFLKPITYFNSNRKILQYPHPQSAIKRTSPNPKVNNRVEHLFGILKALANEDTMLRTQCCRQIVADTNVSPFVCTGNICCRYKFFVRDTRNVFDFVQKHVVSATNVSQFARHGNNVA